MFQRRACGTNFHMYFQHFEGLIREGDELKEVNGVSLEHRKPKDILSLLVSLTSAAGLHCLLQCLLIGCFCFPLFSCFQSSLSSFQCCNLKDEAGIALHFFLLSTKPSKRQSVFQYTSVSLPVAVCGSQLQPCLFLLKM